MAELMLQKQILSKLKNMEKRLNYLVTYIEDSRLNEDDKKALKLALKEEKEGKLLSKKQVFDYEHFNQRPSSSGVIGEENTGDGIGKSLMP